MTANTKSGSGEAQLDTMLRDLHERAVDEDSTGEVRERDPRDAVNAMPTWDPESGANLRVYRTLADETGMPDLHLFDFITERVATGGRVRVEDVPELVEAGITHVIDNRTAAMPGIAEALEAVGIAYLHNPTDDNFHIKGAPWFKPGVDFAMEALSEPGTKVLSHCNMGINRGPSMAYAILRAQGLDAGVAMALLKARRPQVGVVYARDADVTLKVLGYVDGIESTLTDEQRRALRAYREAEDELDRYEELESRSWNRWTSKKRFGVPAHKGGYTRAVQRTDRADAALHLMKRWVEETGVTDIRYALKVLEAEAA